MRSHGVAFLILVVPVAFDHHINQQDDIAYLNVGLNFEHFTFSIINLVLASRLGCRVAPLHGAFIFFSSWKGFAINNAHSFIELRQGTHS